MVRTKWIPSWRLMATTPSPQSSETTGSLAATAMTISTVAQNPIPLPSTATTSSTVGTGTTPSTAGRGTTSSIVGAGTITPAAGPATTRPTKGGGGTPSR